MRHNSDKKNRIFKGLVALFSLALFFSICFQLFLDNHISLVSDINSSLHKAEAESSSFKDAPELYNLTIYPLGVYFTFEEIPGADGYYIYRKSDTDESWIKLALSNKPEYFDKSVSLECNYSYTASAYYEMSNGSLESDKNETGLTCYFTENTRVAAKNVLDQIGWDIYSAYYWCVGINYTSGYTGGVVSEAADYAFSTYVGDCVGMASAFCYLARELGYYANVIYGYVPTASGGISDHAWVEMEYEGATYVCDPEFESDDGLNGFLIYYGQPNTWYYTYDYMMYDYYEGECSCMDFYYEPIKNDVAELYVENEKSLYEKLDIPEDIKDRTPLHNKESREKRFKNARWNNPYYDGPGVSPPRDYARQNENSENVVINESQDGDGCIEDGLMW